MDLKFINVLHPDEPFTCEGIITGYAPEEGTAAAQSVALSASKANGPKIIVGDRFSPRRLTPRIAPSPRQPAQRCPLICSQIESSTSIPDSIAIFSARMPRSPGSSTSSKPGSGLDDLSLDDSSSTSSAKVPVGRNRSMSIVMNRTPLPGQSGFSLPALARIPARTSVMTSKPKPLVAGKLPADRQDSPARRPVKHAGVFSGLAMLVDEGVGRGLLT